MALGEIGRLRRPVIHLGIDIDRVLGVPRRRHRVIPKPLEIRSLRSNT